MKRLRRRRRSLHERPLRSSHQLQSAQLRFVCPVDVLFFFLFFLFFAAMGTNRVLTHACLHVNQMNERYINVMATFGRCVQRSFGKLSLNCRLIRISNSHTALTCHFLRGSFPPFWRNGVDIVWPFRRTGRSRRQFMLRNWCRNMFRSWFDTWYR